MSVLNQMLKDLDERRAMPEQLTLTAVPVSLPRSAGKGLWLVALFVGLAALLFWLLLRPAPQMATVASEEGGANSAAVLTVAAKQATEPTTAPTAKAEQTTQASTINQAKNQPEAAIKDNAQQSELADLTATAAESSLLQATALDISAKADSTKNSNAKTFGVHHNRAPASNIVDSSKPLSGAHPAVAAASNESVLPVETALVPEVDRPTSQAVPKLQIDLLTDSTSQPADADLLQTQFRQLQQLQQQQRWGELLTQIHPALRRSYPQQVFALEAHAATQLGRHQQALQAYQQWALLAPSDGRAWLGQALALDALQQPQQALKFYQKAWQLGGWSVPTAQFIQQRLQQGQ